MHSPQLDFFVAFGSADNAFATQLYDALSDSHKAFLSSRSLVRGSWPEQIPARQAASWITVAVISKHYSEAYYLCEEVHCGINLLRKKPDHHAVIPVFLDDLMPYGTTQLHGIKAFEFPAEERVAACIARLNRALRCIQAGGRAQLERELEGPTEGSLLGLFSAEQPRPSDVGADPTVVYATVMRTDHDDVSRPLGAAWPVDSNLFAATWGVVYGAEAAMRSGARVSVSAEGLRRALRVERAQSHVHCHRTVDRNGIVPFGLGILQVEPHDLDVRGLLWNDGSQLASGAMLAGPVAKHGPESPPTRWSFRVEEVLAPTDGNTNPPGYVFESGEGRAAATAGLPLWDSEGLVRATLDTTEDGRAYGHPVSLLGDMLHG